MRRIPAAVAALAFAVILPAAASAAWLSEGNPVSPVPPQYDSYSFVGAAPDGQGGATFGWFHSTYYPQPDAWLTRIAAQHLDRDAVPLPGWPADELSMGSYPSPPSSGVYLIVPFGAWPDHAGGAYVPTIEYALVGDYVSYVRIHRLTRAGGVVPLGAPFQGLFSAADVAAFDADGAAGMLVTTRERTYAPPLMPLPPAHLFAARVDSLGHVLWADSLTAAGLDRHVLGLAARADGDGGGFFAWPDVRDTVALVATPHIFVQHVLADGSLAPGWPVGGVRVAAIDAPYNQSPRVVLDGAGGVFVAWSEAGPSATRIRATHLLADGTPAPGVPAGGRLLGEAVLNDQLMDLAPDAAGGVWLASLAYDGTGTRPTVLHHLAGDLSPAPGRSPGGLQLAGAPNNGDLAVLLPRPGGVLVAFTRYGGGIPGDGLFVLGLSADGAPLPGWMPGGTRVGDAGTPGPLALVPSDDGAILAWNHTSPGGGGTVFAQRFGIDGPVPVAVALARAEAIDGAVRLRWSIGDATLHAVTLERRTPTGEWSALATLTPDGAGMVSYDDAAVAAGARYGYRLAWAEGATIRTAGEAWVDLPAAAVLALQRPRPNPAAGSTTLRFSLPRAMTASLAIYDAGGRRVRTLAAGALAAGAHALDWDLTDDAGRRVGAGLYFARLDAGEQHLVQRIAALR